MTRHESREQAFILIFERAFSSLSFTEILENDEEGRNFICSDFTRQLITGVEQHEEEINRMIESHLHGWSLQRLSKVTASLLRLGVYEILFEDDIPYGVSIDEAVDLAKTYGSKDDFSYVNGVLSGVLKTVQKEKE